ncbi:MAG: prephenate dehydrogenase/arogenate dehydrogenase family protein [Candidatus Eremiobacteraeota bacterium]|nr:prephenate dehydrogenase/arogenate dehydrogenase family protein [Candidatus Eremiobacteraeota bacterium]
MRPGGPFAVVGIAGVGLIGASIGLRVRQLGSRAIGWDSAGEHLTWALEGGAIDARVESLRALADAADLLVLAAPPDATLSHLTDLGARAYRARLVIDVGSVKTPVARAAANVRRFVGTHPIAGSERSGPGAARADLFVGRTWTYDAAAAPENAARASEFIEAMGATPWPIANEEHDRIVAATSHLPQLLSVALGARLAGCLDDRNATVLCGTGVRSMLRLAGSSWRLWRPILAQNATPVAQEVRRLVDILTGVAADLDAGRLERIGDRFADAAAAIARLGDTEAIGEGVESGKAASNER